ncbi:MAG: amino acid adenylation domain-containing protein [Tabrizicola sp.]|nr:amino acid adenylation domain-containing protein [Tabrizicola sp.]
MLRELPHFPDLTSAFGWVARENGSRPAIAFGEETLSYSDLLARSGALARRLVDQGVGPGDLVGLAATRDPGSIVGMLAIILCGAGYVPLPEYYPAERLRLIAEDAGVRVTLGSVSALSGTGITPLTIDWRDAGEAVAGHDAPLPDGEAVAYVMYTSGSTGVPKGVVVPHRAILRLVVNQSFMQLGPDERILQNSPIAFDAATLEIWGALLNGGTLVIPDAPGGSLRELGEVIARREITTLWLTAGLFHAMADARPGDFAPLRQLLTGGDVVSPASVARVMAACPGLTVINGYGPTENTTFTCCHRISRAEAEASLALPIGQPISGTEVFILDETLAPVPSGSEGELFAAGEGLALGYLGQPGLTEEKFVRAPWDGEVLLYRTGDLARQDEDGTVHYLGRIDTQVKIRGFRVELGEIEAALEAGPGIRQAVVVAREGQDRADKMLVAYCIADAALDEQGLRSALAAKLPDYAIPARFIALEALPLNDNGKVDAAA